MKNVIQLETTQYEVRFDPEAGQQIQVDSEWLNVDQFIDYLFDAKQWSKIATFATIGEAAFRGESST